MQKAGFLMTRLNQISTSGICVVRRKAENILDEQSLCCYMPSPRFGSVQTRGLPLRYTSPVHLVGDNLSQVARKAVFGVSDQVLHKPGLIATESGKRLIICS